MTRKEIEAQITLNLGDTRANTLTQIYNAVDMVLRELHGRVQWSGRIREGFIRTTSGRFQYALEPDFHTLQGNFRVVEDETPLRPMSTDVFNDQIPGPSDTGIPSVYMIPGSFPVRQQPHSKLRLISDSASDTQAATVYGKSYGLITSESVTLTGTTAVLTTKEYNEDYRITLASAAVGTVTATANSTSAQTSYPTVANAGDVTVGTIVAGATASTNVINPGALVRIAMSTDVAGDRNQSIRIEGYTTHSTAKVDRLFLRETLTTNASDSTTSVVSTRNFTEITAIQKGWNSTYTLYVRTDPGNILVAEIGPEQRSLEYPQARFYNITDGKTIHYRYVPRYIKLANDNDIPQAPELYHQLVAEWSEKLVRGWHGDKLGIRTLQNNPEFDRAVAEARSGSRLQPSSTIIVGSGWQREPSSRIDLPITP